MAEDGSYMTTSQSQLSSSTSSLSPSKFFSKTYKNARELYLTRRLPEALSALEPAITVPQAHDERYVNGDDSTPPIASAQSTWRIKVWNLYITLLSSILELGPEEGKKQFGQKKWKSISSQVRDGQIWETVVQTGYRGLEGSVDAEVVYNLATLLLHHSASQALNQQRLETYLSSYGQPSLDIAEHLRNSPPHHSHSRPNGGTDTPKDLAARVKIIELFTLHVLPRNEEWDYAREFINMSEVLDEERKDVFLQTLEGIKEEKEQGELRAAALQREKEAELERQTREEDRRRAEEAAAAERLEQKNQRRNDSKVDSGIEKSRPNGASKAKVGKPADKMSSSKSTPSGRTAFSPPASSKNVKKTDKPARSNRALANVLRNIMQYMSKTVAGNPLSIARTLLFMLGIIVALSRQNIREKIRRITGSGWQKIKGTVGMGVKVSYI
ncbi:hypothetical protein KXW98_009231 [Aspergillus fumigatus]|uniref:Peroxin 26 n=3 Tax=Aspergillus fumigatus TaxID=746128 RepID=Q4WZH1_ASPFU|nr:conserved hypothetical protein [Aspergillus fumigatus Af293]EDP55199.1 conserved hypothetical protein [Aspergillus fumigatus A1163]KAF4252982.1 hypothetical protein CNMCM8714_006871 [Aspergillus fumigatus]KMK61340.1 hypothetical protein Y699_02181 [Aspergillus fumigatus Z5]EAL93994.1 conserved hypothetical protein [Aspergillus fumigatus Af293]KAF4271528.1 hypothetical protein CNMCM8812_000442 [Aspergillus fumigatus]